jgi:RHS repeat-associated protein
MGRMKNLRQAYSSALQQNKPDKLFFYNANHLGSGSLITDGNGDTYQTLAYAPWGESLVNITHSGSGSYDERFKFSGKEKDTESGMSYFGARYFDIDHSGIPISVDRFWMKTPHLSPYTHTGNNPVMLIDVNGDSTVINENGNTISYVDNGVNKIMLQQQNGTQSQVGYEFPNMEYKIGERAKGIYFNQLFITTSVSAGLQVTLKKILTLNLFALDLVSYSIPFTERGFDWRNKDNIDWIGKDNTVHVSMGIAVGIPKLPFQLGILGQEFDTRNGLEGSKNEQLTGLFSLFNTFNTDGTQHNGEFNFYVTGGPPAILAANVSLWGKLYYNPYYQYQITGRKQ